jgi:hypothetical protein
MDGIALLLCALLKKIFFVINDDDFLAVIFLNEDLNYLTSISAQKLPWV